MNSILTNSWQFIADFIRQSCAISNEVSNLIVQDLLQRYQEAHRHYHTLQHLTEMLELLQHESLSDLVKFKVSIAIWFHDAIYDVLASGTNEKNSAELFKQYFQPYLEQSLLDEVYQLIIITAHHNPPTTFLEKLLLDLDLSILGASPKRFLQFEQQIRLEYQHVPDNIFCSERSKILQYFLKQQPLYHVIHQANSKERQARQNLDLAIDSLMRQ